MQIPVHAGGGGQLCIDRGPQWPTGVARELASYQNLLCYNFGVRFLNAGFY